MQLFFEQEFLNDYYLENDKHNLSEAQKILNKLFNEFTELEIFLDCETEEEIFIQFDQNNILKNILTNNPNVKPIGCFEIYFKAYDKPKQALVFLRHTSDWSKTLFSKGFLCFFYDTYEQSIIEIVSKLHFRIDLSEIINSSFKGWEEFERFVVLPINAMVLSDKYILSDKSGQEINKNLIPFLISILEGKQEVNIEIAILTDQIIENTNYKGADKSTKEFEKVKERYSYLNSKFARYNVKFSILKNHERNITNFELHDRIVYTNYSILEIGKGFNLSKNISNDKLLSNSQILCETIFDKYTYIRLKNHFKMLADYFVKLKKFEPSEKPFKYYPDNFYNILFD